MDNNQLLKLYYHERVKKCYVAIPYYFISYLVIISYYFVQDFKIFDPSTLFTLSRLPSIVFSILLIALRYTYPRDGKLKKYWIPLFSINTAFIIYSLYAVTYLTANQPEYFRAGLYFISVTQITLLIYNIVTTRVALSIIGLGCTTFITVLFLNNATLDGFDIPNFLSITIAGILLIILNYNYAYHNFKNLILLKEERNKSKALTELTLEQNEELQQQKEYINKQNQKLITQYNDSQEGLEYAQKIQNAIFPLPNYQIEKVQDYFTFTSPKHIVSGDFYWFGKTEDAQIIAIGDCTGHGVPGALMSMLGVSILDRLVSQEQDDNPVSILEKMHKQLNTLLQQDSTQNNDGMALSIIRIPLFHEQKVITYCGAKCPVLVIKNDTVEFHKGSRYYLGGDISPINKYSNISITIEKNMMLYLYSDGFEDQFGGLNNKKYKSSNFKNLLSDISSYSTVEQKELLTKEFFEWKDAHKADNIQVDDVLVAGFRF